MNIFADTKLNLIVLVCVASLAALCIATAVAPDVQCTFGYQIS
jgi:hypothetical protein